jgi:hypothetical protein
MAKSKAKKPTKSDVKKKPAPSKAKASSKGALSDDELERVAGGILISGVVGVAKVATTVAPSTDKWIGSAGWIETSFKKGET